MIATGNSVNPGDETLKAASPFTVLLVDDEDHILAFIRIKLRLGGYNVLSTGNGSEALDILKSQHVDIAVVDLLMPGVGGLELIERMREFTRIPVIVLTCMDCPEIKHRALSLGANDFLTKPFNPDEILHRVEMFRQVHAATNTSPDSNSC
jgi:DNA-binding response OmpR family regulator